jgi:UDP-glucose 4-epimerase
MKVVALDDLSGGFKANVPEGVVFVHGDIKNATLMGDLFAEHRFDFVYHLAAYAAEGLSHFIRSFNYRTNLVGSVELLNMAVKHHVKCFVFTSSIAVYGSINDLSQMQNPNRSLATSGHKPKASAEVKGLTESDAPTPEDPYGIAKYAFELDLHAANGLFGMDYVVFRPHNVYGPHQNMFDKYRNVVGIFINQIHHGLPMTVFGEGEQVRAFSYIDDVAPVIARGPLVPSARNQVFNVGADRPYTVNQLVSEVSKAMASPEHPIDYQPARMEVEVAVSTHDKVKEYFQPPEPLALDEGLKRTVAWYKSKGKFFQPVEFESVEVLSQMPPSWVRQDLTETATCEGSRVRTEAIEEDRVNGNACASGSAAQACSPS